MDNSSQRRRSVSTVRDRRPRILFVSETVTLAHAARPVVLASALDTDRFDLHLAWHPRFSGLFPDLPVPTHPLHVIPTAQFNQALRDGKPFLNEPTLRSYVDEDRRLIRRLRPDLIVSDFRLSMSLSAALEGIPLWSIASPHWSPFGDFRPLTPENPLVTFIPTALLDHLLFPIGFHFAQRAILAPFQVLRREFGLSPLTGGLPELYTAGDRTLYDGFPDLNPLLGAPDHHSFLGPVLWSPEQHFPAWWDDIPLDRPCLYLNLGTSGNPSLLQGILDLLATRSVSVLLGTAGGRRPDRLPPNAFVADYLPGQAAAARADLVISNGGSGSVAQALVHGTPVLGLASNLDQILCMSAVERAGAGVLLRSFQASPPRLAAAIDRALACRPIPARVPNAADAFRALVDNEFSDTSELVEVSA